MLKKILKTIGVIILILLVVPYFIPREQHVPMPEKPYENSIFFTTQEGIRLHAQYFEAPDSIGKIIMVHGLGASTYSYRNNAPALLEAGYDVFLIDLPAFGYSSKDRDLDHSQVARAGYIWQWLDALDEENNDVRLWNLVGHSMGGSTVLALANQAPERVQSMNLIGPAVLSDNPQIPWLLASPLGEWVKVALNYGLLSEKRFTSVLESASNQSVSAEVVQGYLQPLKVEGSIAALIDFVKTADNVLVDELIAKDIPLNLFWGAEDSWVPLEQAQMIQDKTKVSSLTVFEGAGHLVHETDPDFNAKLIEILALSNE